MKKQITRIIFLISGYISGIVLFTILIFIMAAESILKITKRYFFLHKQNNYFKPNETDFDINDLNPCKHNPTNITVGKLPDIVDEIGNYSIPDKIPHNAKSLLLEFEIHSSNKTYEEEREYTISYNNKTIQYDFFLFLSYINKEPDDKTGVYYLWIDIPGDKKFNIRLCKRINEKLNNAAYCTVKIISYR